MRPARSILLIAVIASLALVAGLVSPFRSQPVAAKAFTCPQGYTLLSDLQAREFRATGERAGVKEAAHADQVCVNNKHPELLSDFQAMNDQISGVRSAPNGSVPANAARTAYKQAQQLPTKPGRWTPLGKGPLYMDPSVGIITAEGRPTDLEYVAKTDQLYASIGYGGVWRSDDHAKTWHSIGDSLPTQIIGSVKYSSAGGGTLIALTGDGSFGADSLEGMGVYWSNNGGKKWNHAKGVPDGAYGFKVAIDHANPKIVYAATGTGLFRSTDAGRTFKNVVLPTGQCAGKSNHVKPCLFVNMVTDVVVMEPGGKTGEKGGQVVAAVGWRVGDFKNPDGTPQAPSNGLYGSANGAPGTFKKLPQTGFAPQKDIGRVELGAAIGPKQDHNYLYAMVQSTILRVWNSNGGAPSIDAPETGLVDTSLNIPSVFDGIYVSPDFGQTWRLMALWPELQEPQTGSSLAVVVGLALSRYGPGIQAWYNMYVSPDPTRQDPVLGAPTRVVFGLEEIWQNEITVLPQIGKSQFKVIGRYYSGDSCLFLGPLVEGQPCPTDREDALDYATTTHPDQHAAVWIPEKDGGVTFVAANDGGIYTQRVDANGELANTGWGNGSNIGFHTLLPYAASIANDGTVWTGLQDNGTIRIDPKTGKQVEKLGGDGFFTAVDPKNSDTAYGEYTFAAMSSTTDGGATWVDMTPSITDTSFSNPFVMDPRNANHLMTGGRQIVESIAGPGTGVDGWKKVFDLGTLKHRGSSSAASDAQADPANSLSAVALEGANAYVGFCGPCDVLDNPNPFHNGLATNVGGNKPPKVGSSQGWHFAKAIGLPNRVITGIAMDPAHPRTIYVSLGGYDRPVTEHAYGNQLRTGRGHVFKSTDAGAHFTNISKNLPNTSVWDVKYSRGRIVVGTEVGAFISTGGSWSRLGNGMPNVWVRHLTFKPDDPNVLIASTYGRGIYAYAFAKPRPLYKPKKGLVGAPSTGAKVGGAYTFDSGTDGWVAATNSTEEWRRQPPGDGSPFAMAVIPYIDESSATLTSPKLTLPKVTNPKYKAHTVTVSWSLLQNTEDGFDYLSVEYSSDGKKWQAAGSGTSGMNPDFPQFSQTSVKFPARAGALYIRFHISSDALISFPAYQGVAVDNVTVTR